MSDERIQQQSIDTIRALAMDAVQQANAGHPGTAMALAPLAYLLYTTLHAANPSDPDWPDRDRFVLSSGHACVLQYATAAPHRLQPLARGPEALPAVAVDHSGASRARPHPGNRGARRARSARASGTPSAWRSPSASSPSASTGPGYEIVDHRIYAICSDGDLMEGVSKEAASIAGQFGLGKLVYFYDDNHITIDGTTAISFTAEDRGRRLEAQGWHVQHVDDAEDARGARGGDRAPPRRRWSGPR